MQQEGRGEGEGRIRSIVRRGDGRRAKEKEN